MDKYVFQIPVPPLPGAGDAPRLFNQQWVNEPDQPLDGPFEKGIPTLITWNHGGNVVLVEGSWDNWTSRYICSKTLMEKLKRKKCQLCSAFQEAFTEIGQGPCYFDGSPFWSLPIQVHCGWPIKIYS